jgi:hypothetical protein
VDTGSREVILERRWIEGDMIPEEVDVGREERESGVGGGEGGTDVALLTFVAMQREKRWWACIRRFTDNLSTVFTKLIIWLVKERFASVLLLIG